MKNIILYLKFILTLLKNNKLTTSKILNLFQNHFFYLIKNYTKHAIPSIVIIEPTNHCNLKCPWCRDSTGMIKEHYKGKEEIEKGILNLESINIFLKDISKTSMIAVFYLHGEPLLNKKLASYIKQCSDLSLATKISTNGMLLTKERSKELLLADIDIIKIAVSGFSQDIYSRYHKNGNIETILQNLKDLALENSKKRNKALILVDYIIFPYNTHEESIFRIFCKENNILFRTRIGDTRGFLTNDEKKNPISIDKLCPWPWHVAVIDWTGELLPCNEYAKTSDKIPLGSIKNKDLSTAWNDDLFANFRKGHIKLGRSAYPACKDCTICLIGYNPKEK